MTPDTCGKLSMAGKVALADRGAKGIVICGRNAASLFLLLAPVADH